MENAGNPEAGDHKCSKACSLGIIWRVEIEADTMRSIGKSDADFCTKERF